MKRTGKIVFMALFLLVSLFVGSYFSTAVNVRDAKIKSMQGTVEVKKSGASKWAAASVGMKLSEGDTVRTKSQSKVVIELDDKSVVQLTSLSTLTLDKMARSLKGNNTNMDMDVGKSWNKVKRQQESRDKFNVSTPTAVAGVRGTYFSGEVEESADSTFDVFEGEISVQQRQDPTYQVYVRTNNRSEVKRGQKPSAPAQIPQDQLQEAISQGIEGGLENAQFDLQIEVNPPVITAGGKAVVKIQFMENGKPYNGAVMFTLSLGGSALFLDNNSQTLEIRSNEKGFATIEITDSVKEQVNIGADVSFEVQE